MEGFLNRVFPVKYDFYKMLEDQAVANSEVVDALIGWLLDASEENEALVNRHSKKCDDAHREMAKKLVEAFFTPFDRGDIYYISVTMRKSLSYAESTLAAMKAFNVKPDDIIKDMAFILKLGTELFVSSVSTLKAKPEKAEKYIPAIRATHSDIEKLYRDGMRAVFEGDDPMEALRHREIYHHLKDSSIYLENSVDILHRIIVRLT